MLWDDVVQRQELQFIRYMRQHHSSWYLYAREELGIACKPEDIILVRGFVKTSAGTVAAFFGGPKIILNDESGESVLDCTHWVNTHC